MAVRTSTSLQNYWVQPSLGTQTKASMTCWVKISVDRNANSVPLMLTNATASSYIALMTSTDGVTMLVSETGALAATGPTMTVGSWYFFGVAWNASSINFTWRALNAAAFSSDTTSLGGASRVIEYVILSNTALGSSGGNFLNGCITAVKIWVGTELTEAQLQNEAWSFVPKYPNPTFWYPLLKTETADYSGNGYTLLGGTGATTEDGPGVGWGTRQSGLYAPIVVTVTHELAAEGLASATGTAEALVGATLAADGVVTSTGAAGPLTAITLETVGLASSAGTADFLTVAVLAADGLATSAATAALGVTLPLAGEAVVTEAGTASVGIEAGLGAAGLATGTGTAAVTTQAPLSAAGLASSAGTASLTGVRALAAAGAAGATGSVEMVVGFIFTGLASSSGTADLTLTIPLGTGVGVVSSSADAELSIDMLFVGSGLASSTGRAVLYIALPYTPGPTGATGRGPGGGVAGPTGRTDAEGVNTGRTGG